MKDQLIRATAGGHSIRIFVSNTKELVQEAVQTHKTTPVASAALGRLLTAGSMMGAMLKGDDDLLTLQIKGDGPLKGIVVTADSQSHVKGYVYQPQVDLPLNEVGKLDVRGAVGAGTLHVIRDTGLKDPYVGQIELISGEIAEDLTYYFATSEQTPSVVALGVLIDRDYSVRQAGGFIIQVMPGASEEVISTLEENLESISSITSLLEAGCQTEDILKKIVGELDYSILETRDVAFVCNCSEERVEKALVSLGHQELQNMINDGEEIELHCHFCNRNYLFSVQELSDLYKAAKN
ncbi:MAG: Hsp33 family molecular chaperone HslO [Epulopiscium sp.]|nr:Hsp33 family molecular chaperone HslO [Candidatus Epulonipiscium sp.]